MRVLRLLVLLFLLPFANAQNANKNLQQTDAQSDGFTGPVRSVMTLASFNLAPWVVPGSTPKPVVVNMTSLVFTLVPVITCRVCDYDQYGNRTRSGQFINTGQDEKFIGSDIAIVRDSAGRMTERTIHDAGTGKLVSHDWFGPFGLTKSQIYIDGKPSGIRTRTYDSAGHMIEIASTDAEGNTVDRMTTKYDEQGQWIERADFAKGGELRRWETYDPGSDTQHYQQFDQSNAVNEEWVVSHNQMLSYWATAEVPGINNGMRAAYFPGTDVYQFRCHKNGDCETFRIHYEYLKGDYNLPTAVERRDTSGALIDAAYIEYSVDEHHNWTTRKVWVVSAEKPERNLHEMDARSITYWPN